MQYYDQIQAYLDGSLSEQEKRAFEQAMSEDEELRMVVDQYPTIKEAVEANARDEARKLVKSVRKSMASDAASVEAKKSSVASRRIPVRRRLAVAASVLVLIIAGTVVISNTAYSTTAIVSRAYQAPSGIGISKSDDGTMDPWRSITALWDSGAQDAAMVAVDSMLEAHPTDPQNQRKAAHFNFLAGNFEASAVLFDELRESPNYSEYADFHYALTLYALDRTDEADDLIDAIAASGDHRFANAARELRAKLHGFWSNFVFE